MAWFAVGLTMLVGLVLTGALLLHTQLAERQLEIDTLERSVREEQKQFDVLRAQRAELRSPTRVAVAAGALGMSPGLESQFIAIDPMVLAITIARTGEVPARDDDIASDATLRPLDQFRAVKALSGEAP
jgi:cell division protein FtsL